jgi:hypothetical protein
MGLFSLAAKYIGPYITEINFWPSLIKKERRPPGFNGKISVREWTVMSFEWHVAEFLKKKGEYNPTVWMSKGILLMDEYRYDYSKPELFTEAMTYLLASDTDILNKVKKLMEENGYDFGQFDPDQSIS